MQTISYRKALHLIATLALLTAVSAGCKKSSSDKLTNYVDPFIGTDGHGHTYPGATLPFGMVQLSPDTRKDSWDGCSGYHYSDGTIEGFSHTHLSGTGVGDYGDIRFMPMVNDIKWDPGTADDPDGGYRSRFSHDQEAARPGYYQVKLEDPNITAELTVSARSGMHQYAFQETDDAILLIDLVESVTSDHILDSWIEVHGDKAVSGLRRTDGWADDQHVYFWAEFSHPILRKEFNVNGDITDHEGKVRSDSIKLALYFGKLGREPLKVKVGISAVSAEGAKNNLKSEIEGWNFNKVRKSADRIWEKELSKIIVNDPDVTAKRIFYTALYHAFLAPNLYSDADGRYRGHDQKIHQAKDGNRYTVFSLWDTYRAAHPLFTLVQPERNADFVRTMMDIYDKGGLLPVWELAANETNCMIGYHAVPVIYDAYVKGQVQIDSDRILKAMMTSAMADQFGLTDYMNYGYIPSDKEGESVSKTLEYAYDDWCIAQLAKSLGDQENYINYIQRSQYYKNLFDPSTGFMRGKRNGMFVAPFDPTEVNFMLTEANTWQYNFYVPHDISGLIALYGGDQGFENKLDEMFNADNELSGRDQADITGLIGQYAHGNEPSHHMAYLYNFVGKPSKTQDLVRRIMDELYTDQPDGLCGNEDCGQMSAWYVMSALGLYPVTPGSGYYVLGLPKFNEAVIQFPEGPFTIRSQGSNSENLYIKTATFNGVDHPYSFIGHKDLERGGLLQLNLSNQPDEAWGTLPEYRPVTSVNEHLITPVPFIQARSKTFKHPITLRLGHLDADARVYYSFSSKVPTVKNATLYEDSILVSNTLNLYARAFSPEGLPSKTVSGRFYKLRHNFRITYKNLYSTQYTAGGELALVDMIRGGENFRTGSWQGFEGVDLDVTIDLGEVKSINSIAITFLEDQNSWIFMPETVTMEVSKKPYDFKTVGIINNPLPAQSDSPVIHEFKRKTLKTKGRYIKIKAKNMGICPPWHKGAGSKSWIFADEVVIR